MTRVAGSRVCCFNGGRSSVGRALDCGSRGRRFDPGRSPHFLVTGPLAQLVEQETLNLLVEGSSPSRPTTSGPAYDAGFLFP